MTQSKKGIFYKYITMFEYKKFYPYINEFFNLDNKSIELLLDEYKKNISINIKLNSI
tara:strand:- start:48 stop:218 length:171 start_codon:yes stop_codon:yes gene_type:complete